MPQMNVEHMAEKLKPIYKLQPGTYREWSKAIKPIADLDIQSVTEDVVLNYRLSNGHLAEDTQRLRLAVLKGIWNKARKWKLITGENPWQYSTDGLKGKRRDPECYPWEFYEYYHNDPYFVCLWYSGMRIGELAGIDKQNIVLDTDIPYFNLVHQKNRKLKNDESIRKVPIHPACMPFVSDLYQSKDKSPGAGWSTNFRKNLGLPKGHGAHTLRHSFTTRMRQAGCDVAVLDRLTGHSCHSITGRYGRFPLEVLDRELRKLR